MDKLLFSDKEEISKHFAALSEQSGLNTYTTIPFVRTVAGTKWFCWNKGMIGLAESAVCSYAKAMNRYYFGSSTRVPKSKSDWLALLAVPEYRQRNGERTYVHYHVLSYFPEERWEDLRQFSQDWWWNKGLSGSESQSPIVIDVRKIQSNAGRVASYSLKNLEDGFTIERTVVRGPLTSN